MRHYCTLFDRNYLDRGLALHRSLTRCRGEFTLHILCLDAPSRRALAALSLPRVELIDIGTLERWDPELRTARHDRTPVEFYFTCKPVLMDYLLEGLSRAERLEYLDSDLFFFSDPASAESEYAGSSVALSPHDFDARNVSRLKYGKFNAGWVSVSGSEAGRRFIRWWRGRCLEWCRLAVEDTRFGDQKYLDQVPGLFPDTALVRHPGANLAPWNVGGRRVELGEQGVLVEGRPLVFFHFHGLRHMLFRVYESGLHDYGVRLSGAIEAGVYGPYVSDLARCRREIARLPGLEPTPSPGFLRQAVRTVRALARRTAVYGAA